MSAPDTDPQKQAEKHRGPLTGMAMAVLWAAVLLVGLVIFLAVRGGTPEAEGTVDSRTGDVSEAAETGTGAPTSDDAADNADGAAASTAADPAATTVEPAATSTGAGISEAPEPDAPSAD